MYKILRKNDSLLLHRRSDKNPLLGGLYCGDLQHYLCHSDPNQILPDKERVEQTNHCGAIASVSDFFWPAIDHMLLSADSRWELCEVFHGPSVSKLDYGLISNLLNTVSAAALGICFSVPKGSSDVRTLIL